MLKVCILLEGGEELSCQTFHALLIPTVYPPTIAGLKVSYAPPNNPQTSSPHSPRPNPQFLFQWNPM